MKSLLLLAAVAFVSTRIFAQSPAANATPAPVAASTPASPAASATPAPVAGSTPAPAAAAGSPAPPGSTNAAAATVPLPGQSTGPTLEKNIPLIPESVPEEEKSASYGHRSHGGASPRPTGTFAVEKDIRTRVLIREAQTRALREDPSIEADWIAAHEAVSDPERRKILNRYYTHLYDEIAKLDPSIAARAEARKEAALERMLYTRLGDLDNSEDPFVAPTPEAEGPNPPEETGPSSSSPITQ